MRSDLAPARSPEGPVQRGRADPGLAPAGRGAGKALLTLIVDDLDEQLSGLEERGLAAGPIDSVPGAVRKAEITDLEGNRITFGHALR